MTKRWFAAAMALLLLIAVLPFAQPPALAEDIVLSARNVLLVDVLNHEVLYGVASRERAFPASLTKIMTTLLILEYAENGGSLDEVATASSAALAGFDYTVVSNANFQVGEEMDLRNILFCMLIASANEACNVAAEHISGSVGVFVEAMNQRAIELGMTGTNFMNTNGQHNENHYTTAWDIYLMVSAAMAHPLFMEISYTANYTVPATNLWPERPLRTTNHLITRQQHSQYYYAPAVGIKTGFTTPAQNCLVALAEQGSLRLVSVVLGAGRDENNNVLSFLETRRLLQWGFSSFERKVLMPARNVVAEASVRMGLGRDHVQLITASPIEAVVPKGLDPETLQRDIEHFYRDGIDAPVIRGQRMGTLVLRDEHRVYGETELIAGFDVERSQASYWADQFQEIVRQPWVRQVIYGAVGLIALYILYVLAVNAVRRRRKSRDRNYRGSKRRHKRR